MGRPPSDPADRAKLFNCYLKPPVIARMKEIVRRLTIAGGKRVTEGAFITQLIEDHRMPMPPTAKQIAAYEKPEPPPQ